MSTRLAIAVGETSGDRLAAAVVEVLRGQRPGLEFTGVTGPRLAAAGVESLASTDELDVMGLFEVVRHVPRLAGLRRRLKRQMRARAVSAFVGFDAPDFNIGLGRGLRRAGVPAVQVVAPSVWAWRRYRVRRIARSLDMLLTLFPFEPEIFRRAGLDARCIGHPLADELPLQPDRTGARAELGLDDGVPVAALLPGSRPGEIARHAAVLDEAAGRLAAESGLQPLLLLSEARHRELFAAAAGRDPAESGMRVVVGQTRTGLTAADVALAASGTVTLEALLCKTPMTVFYRLHPATWLTARSLRLVRSRWVALPNIIAGREIVPERIQFEATAARLVDDVRAWLDDDARRSRFEACAAKIHVTLARNAAAGAARHIVELLERTDHAARRRG
ncbi:MAG: lipid-A-disaccharide synthase [Wenzhouxiangellaceae bacterium]|nr:lipid-A-disaccharide synthase [Wenzhouxiangellaceae bacterium]